MAVLETPARSRALSPEDETARRRPGGPSLRRDPVPDLRDEFGRRRSERFEDEDEEAAALAARRARGVRLRLKGSLPTSVAGRVIAGSLVLAGFGAIGWGLWEARAALMSDSRLVIPSSRAIEISGNTHLTRAQLLSVFGGDVDRNLLKVSMADRRAELESLPWVEHATVMRLLPNRMRVSIKERTPVAFVRQGNEIGLVDAHGVLLDLSPEAAADHSYSFPVLTGVSASDPASLRMARMKLYLKFTGELDSGGEQISKRLSEVDLTDPEDVKALIPDGASEVLVHFGDIDFLTRYQKYVENLPGWKIKYPKLASVDMRYEHEVVLEMQPGSVVPIPGAGADGLAPAAKPAGAVKKAAATVQPKTVSKATAKAKPVVHPMATANAHPPLPSVAGKAAPVSPVPVKHLQKSFDVHASPAGNKVGPQ